MSKKKPTKEELLAMQPASTRALMTDDEQEAKEYFQGLSGKVFVTEEDIASGKSAGEKKMSIEEQQVAFIGRQQVGERLAEMRKDMSEFYQDAKRDPEEEQEWKDRAIDTYMRTPGVQPPDFSSLFAKAAKKVSSVFTIRRKKDKV